MAAKKPRVPKTRCSGTMTEAQRWGWVRSQLRRISMKWKPIYQRLQVNRRPVTAEDQERWGKRIKYVHQCEKCLHWFPRTMIEMDHVPPCGSCNSPETAGHFIDRLLCETENIRCLCEPCHLTVTHQE